MSVPLRIFVEQTFLSVHSLSECKSDANLAHCWLKLPNTNPKRRRNPDFLTWAAMLDGTLLKPLLEALTEFIRIHIDTLW